MTIESPRRLAVPVFLILCLVLGGSGQGIWSNLALQLAAVAMLVWASTTRRSDEPTLASRQLIALIAITGVVIALQLLPLPATAWTALPGRALIEQGYQALRYPLPAQPVSLTPYDTVATVLVSLPAVAVLVATIRVRQRESWLAAALLAAMVAGVLLGALQVATGGPQRSSWYFYPISNDDAVGFFANSNHMGSLLVVSIPFTAALLASFVSRSSRSARSATLALAAAAFVVIVGGIALNRSLAAIGLTVPVLLFSTLLFPASSTVRRLAMLGGMLALTGAILFLATAPSGDISGEGMRSIHSRAEIWKATLELIRQSFPVGTGLGSFESIFPLTEAPAEVRRVYVNHAHNDYLEILLEMGLAGALLLLLFLAWWTAQVVRVWRSALSTHFARAATIASGALLAHSVVDYPLRTVALSAIFAMCLGLMAQPRRERRSADHSQVRPTKHVTIG